MSLLLEDSSGLELNHWGLLNKSCFKYVGTLAKKNNCWESLCLEHSNFSMLLQKIPVRTPQESEFRICVRVLAGEWCGKSLFGQFSFLCQIIQQERLTLMTKWDLKLVTWPLITLKTCTCTCTTIPENPLTLSGKESNANDLSGMHLAKPFTQLYRFKIASDYLVIGWFKMASIKYHDAKRTHPIDGLVRHSSNEIATPPMNGWQANNLMVFWWNFGDHDITRTDPILSHGGESSIHYYTTRHHRCNKKGRRITMVSSYPVLSQNEFGRERNGKIRMKTNYSKAHFDIFNFSSIFKFFSWGEHITDNRQKETTLHWAGLNGGDTNKRVVLGKWENGTRSRNNNKNINMCDFCLCTGWEKHSTNVKKKRRWKKCVACAASSL